MEALSLKTLNFKIFIFFGAFIFLLLGCDGGHSASESPHGSMTLDLASSSPNFYTGTFDKFHKHIEDEKADDCTPHSFRLSREEGIFTRTICDESTFRLRSVDKPLTSENNALIDEILTKIQYQSVNIQQFKCKKDLTGNWYGANLPLEIWVNGETLLLRDASLGACAYGYVGREEIYGITEDSYYIFELNELYDSIVEEISQVN